MGRLRGMHPGDPRARMARSGWRCPLNPIAARYTEDRRDNFDIFLPEWLARHNKTIFGILCVGGLLYTGYLWLR